MEMRKHTTREDIGAPMYVKIVITQRHDVNRVKRIIDKFNPRFLILESQHRLCNLKTLYIAQKLKENGCKDIKMKFYKNELFKVLFSRTPRTSPQGVGDSMPDVDHNKWDEISEIRAPM